MSVSVRVTVRVTWLYVAPGCLAFGVRVRAKLRVRVRLRQAYG